MNSQTNSAEANMDINNPRSAESDLKHEFLHYNSKRVILREVWQNEL